MAVYVDEMREDFRCWQRVRHVADRRISDSQFIAIYQDWLDVPCVFLGSLTDHEVRVT